MHAACIDVVLASVSRIYSFSFPHFSNNSVVVVIKYDIRHVSESHVTKSVCWKSKLHDFKFNMPSTILVMQCLIMKNLHLNQGWAFIYS